MESFLQASLFSEESEGGFSEPLGHDCPGVLLISAGQGKKALTFLI